MQHRSICILLYLFTCPLIKRGNYVDKLTFSSKYRKINVEFFYVICFCDLYFAHTVNKSWKALRHNLSRLFDVDLLICRNRYKNQTQMSMYGYRCFHFILNSSTCLLWLFVKLRVFAYFLCRKHFHFCNILLKILRLSVKVWK